MVAGKSKAVLHRLSGIAVAVLLTLFVAVPTLDLMVCQGDQAVASTSHEHHVQPVASHLDDCAHEDGSAPCPHGHIHSAASTAPALAQVSVPVAISISDPVTRDSTTPAWRTIGQDRPPRV
jgi:hypothetical protein